MIIGRYKNKVITSGINPLSTKLRFTQISNDGSISYMGNYKMHTFTSDASFTVTFPGDVSALAVGGGSGSGSGGTAYTFSGGGGGGQLIENYKLYLDRKTYNVKIGQGGAKGIYIGSGFGVVGYNGGSTSIDSLLVALGGAHINEGNISISSIDGGYCGSNTGGTGYYPDGGGGGGGAGGLGSNTTPGDKAGRAGSALVSKIDSSSYGGGGGGGGNIPGIRSDGYYGQGGNGANAQTDGEKGHPGIVIIKYKYK